MSDAEQIIRLVREQYEQAQQGLAGYLAGKSGDLPAMLHALKLHQLAVGFIKDDLKAVARLRIVDPADLNRNFLVQHNPRRANRQQGAGRTVPPAGVAAVNGGCFLCPDNIWWQQSGIEIGLDLDLNARPYKAWANPFPLKQAHYTVATAAHLPQSWAGTPPPGFTLKDMLEDLIELAQRLPGFLVFYNGAGAGASIPHHRHFQCFHRDDLEPFPLERAAEETARGTAHSRTYRGVVVSDYPVTALHFHGRQSDRDQITSKLDEWTSAWTEVCGEENVSANIIATTHPPQARGGDDFDLYFVPRNQLYFRGPGMTGTIGGLEILGELVFSTELENERLTAGLVDYGYVQRVLAAVEAPRVRDFLRRIL